MLTSSESLFLKKNYNLAAFVTTMFPRSLHYFFFDLIPKWIDNNYFFIALIFFSSPLSHEWFFVKLHKAGNFFSDNLLVRHYSWLLFSLTFLKKISLFITGNFQCLSFRYRNARIFDFWLIFCTAFATLATMFPIYFDFESKSFRKTMKRL